MSRRYIAEVTRAAVLEELRSGVAARELSRKYSISESTISRWKKGAGIDATHGLAPVRSKPLPKSDSEARDSSPEGSSGRRGMIQRMIKLVNTVADDGHLKSGDIRNLALAGKALAEADARLEKEEQVVAARAAQVSPMFKGREEDYDALVGLYSDRTPKNIEVLFAVFDVEQARLDADTETEEAAFERIKAGCRKAGLPDVGIPIDRMIQVANKEHDEKYGPAETPEEGPLEYQGEGRP